MRTITTANGTCGRCSIGPPTRESPNYARHSGPGSRLVVLVGMTRTPDLAADLAGRMQRQFRSDATSIKSMLGVSWTPPFDFHP